MVLNRIGMTRTGQCLLIAVVIICLGWFEASAQGVTQSPVIPPATPVLQVGLHLSPPFVVKTGETYSGMAVDLWEMAAARLGLRYEYRPYRTLADLVQATATAEVDAAVGNLTISRERAQRLDFTQAWYDSGIRIMIKQNRTADAGDIFRKLTEGGYFKAYLWFGLLLLVATLLLTILDRKLDFEFPRSWLHGLSESFYHVIAAITSGRSTHKPLFGAFGRVLAAFWLLFGVAVIATITSSITSTMTTVSLQNQINDRSDLSGRIVGVLAGSSAETYARALALDIRLFPGMDEAVAALIDDRIDAILGDAPVLEYYDNNHLDLPLTEVGSILKPEKYGFALPPGSPLTRPLTVQLLELHESGALETVRARYFGVTP